MELEFSRQIFVKSSEVSNFMKIRRVGAEFHPDGRTDGQADRQADTTKPIVALQNFAKASKNTKRLEHFLVGLNIHAVDLLCIVHLISIKCDRRTGEPK